MKSKKKCLGVFTFIFFVTALFGMSVFAGVNYQCPPFDPIIKSKAPLEHVQAQIAKLAPITIAPDIPYLSHNEQEVIFYLIAASKYIDQAFLKQVNENNLKLLNALKKYRNTPEQVYYDYFKIMYGPWDRLDGDAPFINLDEFKPLGANYYPADLTPEEFETWLTQHPEDTESFTSCFTMIRRDHHGHLKAIPYPKYFGDILLPVSGLLLKAAHKTADPTLAKYLKSRAKAFFTNDYRQSDIDWIGLNGDIELVIGSYEVYEDGLFGYKAAYESFVCVVDREESNKLNFIENYRQAMIDNYPLPDGLVLKPKGLASPIKVVNEVFTAGDARQGIPAIAFNLPNDEWVRENVGSKNVMLKNIMDAKFNGVLIPIKDLILAAQDRDKPSFDGFFNHVLLHEISHGLGPGTITVDGRETTVRAELKELYSMIEECQADTLAVYNTQFLIDTPNSPMPPGLEDGLYASYLAGMFRSIRFGTGSAHGGAITIQLNYHLANGGFNIDANGLFYLDQTKLKASIRSLAEKLLTIELTGDYNGAKELIDTYCYVAPQVQTALDIIQSVPTDVRKIYPY